MKSVNYLFWYLFQNYLVTGYLKDINYIKAQIYLINHDKDKFRFPFQDI